jgi:hypothetical protein
MAPFSSPAVAEFQGLYGPFSIAERVLQKIWLHGDFVQAGAKLADGRRIERVTPGAWNLLGGPDFRDAQLKIDGREVRGDVEVHFHSSDWTAHGHATDPSYARVVLHVVLFPSDQSARVRRVDGVTLPTLFLLPLLHRALEEYAADDALETLTARDDWRRFAELAAKSRPELNALLHAQARARWAQKLHFARRRIEKLGWSDAAHHTALEILGYRLNRAPMLELAARRPLPAWREPLDVEAFFQEGRGRWFRQGVRPANQPLTRLRQYQQWVRTNTDWPEHWKALATALPFPAPHGTTKAVRSALQIPELRTRLLHDLCGDALGGTRLDTLVCDGLLPLAAAATGRELYAYWFHWYLGDVPAAVRRTLRRLEVADGRDRPLCHGLGQGLLGWILDHETRASS